MTHWIAVRGGLVAVVTVAIVSLAGDWTPAGAPPGTGVGNHICGGGRRGPPARPAAILTPHDSFFCQRRGVGAAGGGRPCRARRLGPRDGGLAFRPRHRRALL